MRDPCRAPVIPNRTHAPARAASTDGIARQPVVGGSRAAERVPVPVRAISGRPQAHAAAEPGRPPGHREDGAPQPYTDAAARPAVQREAIKLKVWRPRQADPLKSGMW